MVLLPQWRRSSPASASTAAPASPSARTQPSTRAGWSGRRPTARCMRRSPTTSSTSSPRSAPSASASTIRRRAPRSARSTAACPTPSGRRARRCSSSAPGCSIPTRRSPTTRPRASRRRAPPRPPRTDTTWPPRPRPPAAPAAKPAAAPAKAAAPKPVVGVRGRVEKPVAKPPAAPRPARSFAGELPTDFDQLLAELGSPRRRLHSRLAVLLLSLLAAGQGLLGALGAGAQERIDAAIADRRFFNPQLATAANVFLNLVLYPIVILALAVSAGRADLFSLGVHKWIFLGLALGFTEAAFRMRESLFGGVPFGAAPVRGALYAPLVWPLGRLVVLLAGARGSASGVGFDGFYGGEADFDEKLERERRYGSIYKIVDPHDAYILRLEFPRRLPPSSLADELG